MPTNDSTAPTWATDTNYTSGAAVGEPLKVDAPSGEAAQGLVAGETLKGAYVNALLFKMIAWLADAGRGTFGDGSDGDVTITGGTTTLTRDMYYENLTITGTGVLATGGYKVFVRNLCTIDSGGVMSNDGGNGGTPANNSTGGTAGAAAPGNTVGAGFAGGAGGNASAAGSNGTSATSSLGGAGGNGGASNDTGSDASEAGGTGGTVTAPTGGFSARHLRAAHGYTEAGTQFRGGAGGGGGGGGDTGTGGGGGGGGGVLVLFAYRLINNGSIRTRGGNGGAAFTGPDALGNGGGGTGGGGLTIVVSRGYSGAGTITAPAGVTVGAGHLAGSAGSLGAAGTVIRLAA